MNIHENTFHKSEILRTVLLSAAFMLLFVLTGLGITRAKADRLYPSFYSTDGSDCVNISDGSYFTSEYFDPGTEITLTCDEPIDSLYIIWEEYPGTWTLSANGTDYPYGPGEYLHEYIKLPEGARGASEITIKVTGSRIVIADIYAFSAGELPSYVQIWEPSYDEADILFISTHADDEVLFFGGLIPNYTDQGNVRVQVAYFSDLFQSEPYRNHEILNGLWTMGVTHYPQLGEFYDNYSESYEEAAEQFDYNEGLSYIVRTIRRFKPQVVVGQDIINGEYGHGGHIWCAKLIADAVEITGDDQYMTDSAKEYGTWDVSKTYFHLYPENTIEANARKPLSSFGGKTALEVAKQAYEEHQSQQWTWFAVSDGYDDNGNPADDKYSPYSCTRYGLYKTTVGDDYTGSDILDNIVVYDEQERIAQEEARAAQLKLEQEQAAAAQAEADEKAQAAFADSVANESSKTAVPGGKNTTALTIFIVLAIIVAVIIVGILVLSKMKRKEEERRRMEKRRRMMASQNAKRNSTRSAARPREVQRTSGQTGVRNEQRAAGSARQQSANPNASSASAKRNVSRSSNGTYNPDRTGRR